MAGIVDTLIGLLQSLASAVLAGLALLWQAVQGSGEQAQRPAKPKTAAQEARKARRKQAKQAAAAPAAAASGGAPAKPAATPPAPAPASESDSESEEEEEVRVAPRVRGYAGGATTTISGPEVWADEWEPAGGKKPARTVGGTAARSGGSAAASRSGGPASKAATKAAGQERKRGVLRVCERPDCGAEGRGFRACGRCHNVWYCTPACLGSDWERHQLRCNID